jgi:filamentous hemagglutinin family protein
MNHRPPAPAFALRPIACFVMLACGGLASANPTAPAVSAGSAGFHTSGSTLTVTNTPGTIINWQGFSIGAGELTHFQQKSASSAVLNRVVGNDPSSLLGSLTSNGRVFLVNPHGIVVGAGARIDTAAFIASTLNISDSDFLQGRLKFEGGGHGVLRNDGEIRASGDIMLVGPAIENTGLIRSQNGSVLLAAGRKLTITSPDAQGVRFELQAPSDTALNVGSIEARGAASMLAGTLRHSGEIRATAANVDERGRVTLVAQKEAIVDKGSTVSASGPRGGDVTIRSDGLTWVAGKVDATGTAGAGGNVQILGERVGVSGADVDASGKTGGGTILVGGGFQGRNPDVPNAKATYVGPDATLKADAGSAGDGGTIVVWGNDTAQVYGTLSVRGGPQGGNGGFVETSGHYLEVARIPDISAPHGRGGKWLLDPGEVVISAGGGDANLTAGPAFTPLSPDEVSRISQALINSALVTGDVSISTGSAGAGSGDITFDASPTLGGSIVIDKIDMATPLSILTLNAARDIRFSNGATTFRTSGGGTPVLTVRLVPGSSGTGGGIFTDASATVTLSRTSAAGAVVIEPAPGVRWQNNGTINIGANTGISLAGGATSAATLANMAGGVINIDSAPDGAALASSASDRSGIVDNAGTVNVEAGTSFDVAFTNAPGATLAVNNGSILRLTNPRTIGGTVTLTGGGTLRVADSRAGGGIFSGTSITGGGTVDVQSPGDLSPVATFRNVDAPATGLTVGANGTALFDTAPSTFGSVSVQFVPNPGVVSGVLTSDTGLTINTALDIGGTATFNGPTSVGGSVFLGSPGGGTLGGSGAFSAPTLNWVAGTITGAGRKTFSNVTSADSGGAIHLAGNVGLDGPAAVWTNNGTLSHDGAGQLMLSNGATVNNALGSSWNVSSSNAAPISHGGGAATTFNNAGTFTHSGATPHTVSPSAFRNTGVVNVNSNSLTLGAGAGAGPANSDTGRINLNDGGTTLVFSGDRTLDGAPSIVGNGNVTVSAGTVDANGTMLATGAYTVSGTGIANFNTPITPSTVTVAGGTGNFSAPLTTGSIAVSAGTANFAAAVTDNGQLIISNTGIANFNGSTSVAGAFNESGGTLGGSALVNLNGAATWSGGAMEGSGTTTVIGPLALSGAASKDLTAGRTLIVPTGSVATWSGTGSIRMDFGARINNAGTWNDQSENASIQSLSNPVTFNNAGTYTKSLAGTTTIDRSAAFNNTGTVNVNAGTLRIAGGGVSTGAFTVPATLDFGSGYTVNEGSSITGSGAVVFSLGGADINGGVYNVSGRTTVLGGETTFAAAATVRSVGTLFVGPNGTITLNSGETIVTPALTLFGTIAGSDLINVTGVATLGAGLMTGPGVTNANGGLLISGPIRLSDGRTLNNFGAATLTGGSSSGFSLRNATINNRGTWDDRTDGGFIDGFEGISIFNNTGTYTKSGSFGTTTIGSAAFLPRGSAVLFNNSGVVNVDRGTLLLSTGGTSTGNFNVNTGGSVDFSAGTYNVAGGSITGTGIVRFSGATVNVNGGTYNMSASGATNSSGGTATFNAASTTINVGALSISGSGTVTLSSGEAVAASTLDLGAGALGGTDTINVAGATNWFGGTMTGTGTTNANGNVSLQGINHTLEAGRTFANTARSTALWDSGSITIGGGAAISNAGTWIDRSGNGSIINSSGGATFTNTGTYTKSRFTGITTIGAGVTLNNTAGTLNVDVGTFRADGGFPRNDGAINVAAGATFSTTGRGLLNAGTIGGEGTVDLGAATLTNLGTLRPGAALGDTTGALKILGNLTQAAAGKIDLELGGTGAGAFDVVTVSGTAALAGTVNVSAIAGYTPDVGDAFPVITAATRTGNFSTVNKSFATNMTAAYANTGLQFTIGGGPVNTWISASGDWSVGGNWNLGHVPGSGEIALIPDGPGTQTITIPAGTFTPDALTSNENLAIAGGTLSLANASTINGSLALSSGALQGAGAVTVNGNFAFTGGTLGSTGGVNVTGTTSVSGATQLGGTLATNLLNVSGATLNVGDRALLNVTGPGASTVDAATLANAGTLRVSGGGTLTVAGTASFTNPGTIDVQNGTAIVNGFASNPGTINVGLNSRFTTTAPALANAGAITLGSGASFSTSGSPLTNTGSIGGKGTLDLGGATLTNNGTVAPGPSPGALAINGNYTQGPAGVLAIELGGTTAGVTYDQLQIAGAANLDGTLNLTTFGGFTPAIGTRFDFMTYASRTGDFARLNFPANTRFQATPGPTVYSATPTDTRVDNTATSEVKTITTKDALIFNDRLTKAADPVDSDLRLRRETIPECR